MPLELLLMLVIGGIAGIALALHLLGLSRTQALDEDAAMAGWTREYPEDPATSASLTPDARAALVRTRHDSMGLVWRFGADTVAHPLTASTIAETKNGLMVRFDDYGTPSLRLRLEPEDTANWKQRLEQT